MKFKNRKTGKPIALPPPTEVSDGLKRVKSDPGIKIFNIPTFIYFVGVIRKACVRVCCVFAHGGRRHWAVYYTSS